MLEQCLYKICNKHNDLYTYTMRGLLMYMYTHQLTQDVSHMFDSFFTHQRDAAWCRRVIRCRVRDMDDLILWPPLQHKPITNHMVIHVRGDIFVPVLPRIYDHVSLSSYLSIYDAV